MEFHQRGAIRRSGVWAGSTPHSAPQLAHRKNAPLGQGLRGSAGVTHSRVEQMGQGGSALVLWVGRITATRSARRNTEATTSIRFEWQPLMPTLHADRISRPLLPDPDCSAVTTRTVSKPGALHFARNGRTVPDALDRARRLLWPSDANRQRSASCQPDLPVVSRHQQTSATR